MLASLEPSDRTSDIGQAQNRIAQRAHLARSGAPQRGPPGEPLEIAYTVECFAQPLATATVPHQDLYGVEA